LDTGELFARDLRAGRGARRFPVAGHRKRTDPEAQTIATSRTLASRGAVALKNVRDCERLRTTLCKAGQARDGLGVGLGRRTAAEAQALRRRLAQHLLAQSGGDRCDPRT